MSDLTLSDPDRTDGGVLLVDRPVAPTIPTRPPVRRTWWRWLSEHRHSALVLSGLLVLAGFAQGVNQTGAPQWVDDEGTYVAQAWAVFHLHRLAPYTYWYDHPPLGWIQLAAVLWVTGALHWAGSAVDAGRMAMLLAQLVNVALLWLIGRRLGLTRWATAIAVGLFSLSPLAIQFHRQVYLDNISACWLLAAIALALSPRRRLAAFAASGVAFAVAVLSKETTLLLLPAMAFLLWQRSRGGTRRYAIAVSASLFVLVGVFYPLYALLKGELLPGPGHVSLLGAVQFQLFNRTPSGSIFQSGTVGHRTVMLWLARDRVFPLLAGLAVVPGLILRRLRPIAVGLLILLLTLLRPGYLPVPFVIVMLPLGALLVAGVADSAWRWRPRQGRILRKLALRRPLAPALLGVGLVAGVVAVPAWTAQDQGLWQHNDNAPMLAAERWLVANVPHNQKIIVDDSLWLDLVRSGFPRHDVVWFYKVNTDPAVEARAPNGWRSYSYLVSTESIRSFLGSDPQVQSAMTHSVPVASYGHGYQQVVIRRILTGPGQSPAAVATAIRNASARRALATDPRVSLTPTARHQLLAGGVDPHLVRVLSALTGPGGLSIQIAGFPAAADDVPAGGTVTVTAVNGAPVTPGATSVRALLARLAPTGPDAAVAHLLTVSGPDATTMSVLQISVPPAG